MHGLYRSLVFLVSLAVLSMGLLFTQPRVLAASSTVGVGLVVSALQGFIVQWAVPEGRVGAPGTNWSTNFALSARPTDQSAPLQTMTDLATTDETGYSGPTPLALPVIDGRSNDIFIKTDQHLAKKITTVLPVGPVNTTLNFTQLDNSAPLGDERLLAGDVNNTGTTPATLGDNVVNAVDLSVLLARLDDADATTKSIRSNFNRDPVVNSIDLSLLLKNLDVEGDR